MEAAANNLSGAAKSLVDVSTSDPNSRGQISLRQALQYVKIKKKKKKISFSKKKKKKKKKKHTFF